MRKLSSPGCTSLSDTLGQGTNAPTGEPQETQSSALVANLARQAVAAPAAVRLSILLTRTPAERWLGHALRGSLEAEKRHRVSSNQRRQAQVSSSALRLGSFCRQRKRNAILSHSQKKGLIGHDGKVRSWGEALLNHSPRQTARENQAY